MQNTSQIRIQTLFYWCNDVLPIQYFYTELIGLEETFFSNDDHAGWLTYRVGEVDVVFMRTSVPLPIQIEWAKQPGYLGGTQETHSFILYIPPAQFPQVRQRLQAADVPVYQTQPTDSSTNRQYFVQDPMGMTVEIYTEVQDGVS